jgi:hypothetical protein
VSKAVLAGLEGEIGAPKGYGLEIKLKTRARKNRLVLRKGNKAEDVEIRRWGQEDVLLSMIVFGIRFFFFFLYSTLIFTPIAIRHASFSCD